MMKKRVFPMPLVWLVLFALFNLFTSGRWALPAAAWLAPIFGLHYLYTRRGKGTFLLFYLSFWVTLSISWFGATPFWGVAHFGSMLVTALLGALPFLVDWKLAPRLVVNGRIPFVATLIFPAAGTTIEYLTISANPIGNFGAVGYSQYGVGPLLQLNAVTGMLGLAFLISWFASTVNWAWGRGFAWKQIRSGVVVYAVVLVMVLGYGAVRLLSAPAPGAGEQVRIASFTADEVDMETMNALLESDPAAFRTRTQSRHAAYLARTAEAAADGAQIVVWPEMAGLGVAEDVEALLAEGRALAEEQGIYLAMTTMALYPESERPGENVLRIAGPEGEIVLEHVKFGGNMIEGTLKGSGVLQTVETPYGTLSGVICWDTDFPGVIRQAGQQGVDILLSPSYEWAGIDPMHGEMSTFRAVENGMTVVRQADHGWSVVSDAYGRVLAEAEAGEDGMLIATVSSRGANTFYAQAGDFMGLFSVATLVVLGGWAIVAGRRREVAPDPVAAD